MEKLFAPPDFSLRIVKSGWEGFCSASFGRQRQPQEPTRSPTDMFNTMSPSAPTGDTIFPAFLFGAVPGTGPNIDPGPIPSPNPDPDPLPGPEPDPDPVLPPGPLPTPEPLTY